MVVVLMIIVFFKRYRNEAFQDGTFYLFVFEFELFFLILFFLDIEKAKE
jgi:hypothetical protein